MTKHLSSSTIAKALDSIAARTPAPGGGAAVALSGAVAAALGEMVAAYAGGRKANADCRAEIDAHGRILHEARNELLKLADDDARAYGALSDVMAQQKCGEASEEAVGMAAKAAAHPPMAMIKACERIIAALEGLCPFAGQLMSDLVASAAMASAAARGAAQHVRANAPLMDEAGLGGTELVARASALADEVASRAKELD